MSVSPLGMILQVKEIPTLILCIVSGFNTTCSFIHFSVVNPMDYLELNTILSFAACETRRCVNVTIVDDLVDEPLESFDYTLERTPGLDSRISLDPVDGVVQINDNDGNIIL